MVKYVKDRLSTKIAKQKRRKQRLAEDIVKVVVESNQLYVRTQKNINEQPQVMMHQRIEPHYSSVMSNNRKSL